ncbi:MAG: MinD/ParA family protein [SAR324 cluster bacterium]|nr:MinD/ParA family protein [SAR324 cluster bacterium]
MDQASTLRQIVNARKAAEPLPPGPDRGQMRVIAITSGKGGVGKTNIVVNLCIALTKLGRRVLLLDGDMGLANVDVLLGLTPKYTLEHVLKGQKGINDIVLEGPHGIRLLPSSSGMSELSEMNFEQQMFLFRELSQLDEQIDYLFIDTGAGVSSNVLRFNASANEILVIANSEPTSITDAYALMKLLSIKYHIRDFGLVANSVQSDREGLAVYNRLNAVCRQFLQVNLSYVGSVPFDQSVRKAVRRQRPVIDLYPFSPAGKSITNLAASLDASLLTQADSPAGEPVPSGRTRQSFWDRLLHWKKAQ